MVRVFSLYIAPPAVDVSRLPLNIQDSSVRIPLLEIAPPLDVARPSLKYSPRIRTSAVLSVIRSSWDMELEVVQEAALVRVTPFPTIVRLFVISGKALVRFITVVPAVTPLKVIISPAWALVRA
jgi:hypothetical protein